MTGISVGMSVALLLPLLDIASTCTAAAKTKLDEQGEDGKSGGDPHEHEHLDANLGFEVQLCHTFGGHFENDEDDGSEDCRDGGAKSGEKGERSNGKVGPTGIDG